MPKIIRRKNETVEQLVKRFKRLVDKIGTLKEAKARRYYEKPSYTKYKARKAAERRSK